MNTKILGIVGGLDSETSAKFLLEVNRLFRAKHGFQPNIVLDNISLSVFDEKAFIKGKIDTSHKEKIQESIDRLVLAGVDFIVIPCNSVHVFIDSLKSKVPILNIIDLTLDKADGEKIGLLATSMTIKQGLFSGKNKEIIVPSRSDQQKVDSIIVDIISGKKSKGLEEISKSLVSRGAEKVILGCTTLHRTLNSTLHVDSLQVLSEKVLEVME
tara:strand:+ start:786 stop:1424 length:639 start_codon:yes stop_codon:yes gene_type:complete